MKTLSVLSLSGALLALPLLAAANGDMPRVLDSAQAKRVITVEDVTTHEGKTSGALVNNGREPIHEVRLVVEYHYRWPNEWKPGKHDPGVAHEFTLDGTIPPGGREIFTVASAPPAPPQRGGRFVTDVKVLEFAQLEPVHTGHTTAGM